MNPFDVRICRYDLRWRHGHREHDTHTPLSFVECVYLNHGDSEPTSATRLLGLDGPRLEEALGGVVLRNLDQNRCKAFWSSSLCYVWQSHGNVAWLRDVPYPWQWRVLKLKHVSLYFFIMRWLNHLLGFSYRHIHLSCSIYTSDTTTSIYWLSQSEIAMLPKYSCSYIKSSKSLRNTSKS